MNILNVINRIRHEENPREETYQESIDSWCDFAFRNQTYSLLGFFCLGPCAGS